MENNSLKWYSALGMGLLYMATVFAACFFGLIGPVFWAFFPVVAALLGSGAYFWLSGKDGGLSGHNEKWEKMIDGMHTYTPDEVKTHLTAAQLLSYYLCKHRSLSVLYGHVNGDFHHFGLGCCLPGSRKSNELILRTTRNCPGSHF